MEVIEGSGKQTHWAQYREYQGVVGGSVVPIFTPAVIGTPSSKHKHIFTYQAAPADSGGTRKRMCYLKDNTRMGDTFFNEWPAPMYQLAQMTKITNTGHDSIFAVDAPVDEGAEDSAGAAMVTD